MFQKLRFNFSWSSKTCQTYQTCGWKYYFIHFSHLINKYLLAGTKLERVRSEPKKSKNGFINLIKNGHLCIYHKNCFTFWPPDNVIPLSPTSVLSPKGNCSKSLSKAQTDTISRYFSYSNGRPNKMFWRSVPENIHASWQAKATRPVIRHLPDKIGSSWRIAWSKDVFPEPIGPTAITSLWPESLVVIPLRSLFLLLLVQRAVTFSMWIEGRTLPSAMGLFGDSVLWRTSTPLLSVCSSSPRNF